ncbi:MAG: hypothetical protein AB8H79_00185, partial [Myxococcota bacterium]
PDAPDGDCDPTLEGDPDCLRDGECNVEDAEDPDCEACDYTPDAPECQPDPCDEPNPPPECDPFTPETFNISGSLGFDAGSNEARSYFVGEEPTEVQPTMSMRMQDARYASTSNVDYLCNLELRSTGEYAPPGAAYTFTRTAQGIPDQTLDHYGVTWTLGNYEIVDAPFQAQAGTVEGCTSKYFDPAIYGDDIIARLNERDWGLGWGPIESQVEGLLTNSMNDDVNDDYDMFDLYATGFACGGSQLTGENRTAYLATLGYAVDESWQTVDSGNEADPIERIPCSAMEPDAETGLPATGIYFLRAYGNWNASFLLGVQ